MNQLKMKHLKKLDFSSPLGLENIRLDFNGIYWKAYEKKPGFYLGEGHLIPYEVDYLRNKGYALPWMNLSVQDMVDYGWIKLKE